MRQVKGVQGRYEAGKWGARQVRGRQNGCEAGTRQVKGVQGRYKAGERSARQVQAR